MPRACALALDNLRPIAQSLLTERITALTPARMHQVCRALRLATNC
jgi:mRNA interferase MazF